jgi:lipopolysaccharide/colanic/teichoic acid biosynthesis glycosyltransferase
MKRTLDIFGAGIGLVIFAPLLAYLVWRIGRDLGSPTIFHQTRPGKHGVAFQMVKFRTMRNASGPDGTLLPDAERISPLGTKLRSTSLDELPEFWNVLKGEMSLVGPRPLLMEYLPLYTPEQTRRHDVRPGITGWAQVNGRNAISWEEKFALDVWYVDNRTIWLDFKIIWMTVKKVLIREGISAEGEVTMSKFTGEK